MKNQMKRKKGITLIALVVTIIVLLILAGVTIATLTGDNGLLTKAGNAKNTANESEIMEKIKLAYQDYYLGQHTQSGYTFQNAVDKMFGEEIATVTEGNGVYTVRFKNGREYTYNVVTGITEKVAKWNDNEDGTWTNEVTGARIQIGDIVNYDPTKDKNGNTLTTTYTSYAKSNASSDKNEGRTSGYSSDQTFSVSATTNGWRVLGINESGQIELISVDPIQTLSNTKYYFGGASAYLSGKEELNAVCSIFGYGKGAENARSLNVDDIDKLAGITTDADKKACSQNYYGTKYQYRYPTNEEVSGTRYMQYRRDTGSGYASWVNITAPNYQKFKMPGESSFFGKINDYSPKIAGYSEELFYTDYSYRITLKVTQIAKDGTNIANLICKGTSNSNVAQWLASTYIYCSDYVNFGLRAITGDYVSNYVDTCNSTIDGGQDERYVRPVIVLESNVRLSGDSTNGWTIQ